MSFSAFWASKLTPLWSRFLSKTFEFQLNRHLDFVLFITVKCKTCMFFFVFLFLVLGAAVYANKDVCNILQGIFWPLCMLVICLYVVVCAISSLRYHPRCKHRYLDYWLVCFGKGLPPMGSDVWPGECTKFCLGLGVAFGGLGPWVLQPWPCGSSPSALADALKLRYINSNI